MSIFAQNTPIVIDIGTGFTKIGYGGNTQPQYILPTVIGPKDVKGFGGGGGTNITQKAGDFGDLDFLIGDDSISNSKQYPPKRFMEHGLVSDWDLMEKYYEHIFFRYLRCSPESQNVLITEPPLNTPENREYLAEVMFETFNVPGLYIAVQALLSICATWTSKKQTSHELTGTVIDSGEGVTHIIPVADGYVIPSGIKHIPIAGSDFTKSILDTIRDREGNVPPDEALNIAKAIKEDYCYVTSDLLKEFQKYDDKPKECFKEYSIVHPLTKKTHTFGIGYEQFLTPEIFFSPDIYSSDFSTPLPQIVDDVIQISPIDVRRKLYGNVVLSGGSTLFPNFGRRIQRDLQAKVDARLLATEKKSGTKPSPIPCKVITHGFQKYAVWFGGSMLSIGESFANIVKTKKEYDEKGPSICRASATFTNV